MKTIGIEEILLEYHTVLDKNWNYTIECVDEIPENIFDSRSVCINGAYIQFYEKMNIEESKSTIFWSVDFIKKELLI